MITWQKEEKIITIDFSDESIYNDIYIPLLHDHKRYNLLMGGGGSWKSVFVAQREIIESFKKWNRCLCVRKVKDTHRDSCYAQLVEVINLWWLADKFEMTTSPMSIKNKLTGSDFIFRGLDDPEKIKSVVWVTRVWMEEATEFIKKDFDQIDLRLRGLKQMQITLSFNPIDKDHWLNTDFWSLWWGPDITLLHSTYRDNYWAGEQYEKVMNRLKEQDPNMYAIYALGEWWNKVEGLIFEFEEIDDVPDEAIQLGYGQDFWFSNDPSVLVDLYQWNGGVIWDEVFYRTGLTNGDIVNLYKANNVSTTAVIVGDSSEPKSIEEIHRAGYNIQGAVKWPDSILFGIQIMKQQKIYVTRRSTNLKKEFLNYCWAKDRTGKVLNRPIDAFNHGIDGWRYGVSKFLGKKTTSFIGVI